MQLELKNFEACLIVASALVLLTEFLKLQRKIKKLTFSIKRKFCKRKHIKL